MLDSVVSLCYIFQFGCKLLLHVDTFFDVYKDVCPRAFSALHTITASTSEVHLVLYFYSFSVFVLHIPPSISEAFANRRSALRKRTVNQRPLCSAFDNLFLYVWDWFIHARSIPILRHLGKPRGVSHLSHFAKNDPYRDASSEEEKWC